MGQFNLTSDIVSSLCASTTREYIIMSAMAILSPVMDLVHNAFVQEKVEEVAKLFFTSDTVSINLIPGLIVGALLLLLLIPMLALLFQPAAAASEGGYGGYSAPEESYGAPESSYGAPEYRSGKSDASWEDFKSLFSNLLSAKDSGAEHSLTKRMQEFGPLISNLGSSADNLLN